jgi:phage terminase small subunit
MSGPPPKPASQRRRRNAGPPELVLGTRPRRRAPKPPEGLSDSTLRWWRTVWRSPMATAWLEADTLLAERLATLIEMLAQGRGGARLVAEIRALEDRLGLSPAARRRLGWLVESEAPPERPPLSAVSDIRERLHRTYPAPTEGGRP